VRGVRAGHPGWIEPVERSLVCRPVPRPKGSPPSAASGVQVGITGSPSGSVGQPRPGRGGQWPPRSRRHRAMRLSVEEAVGHASDQPQLGVHALGKPLGEAVRDRRDDPGPVLLDPVVELDERGDLASPSPPQLRVEHGDRLGAAVLEHQPEVYAIAGTIRPWYRALVLMAAFTSLRWGELIGLRRLDLDLDAGFVTVRWAVVEIDSKLDGGRPKSLPGCGRSASPRSCCRSCVSTCGGGRSRARMAGCSRGRTARRRGVATSAACGRRRLRRVAVFGEGLVLAAIFVAGWWSYATDWHSTASLGPAGTGWFVGPLVVIGVRLVESARASRQAP
jgi:hypothetical protein